MKLSNAAGLLQTAAKASSMLGKASPALSMIGGPYAGIASKALEKAPDLINKLQDKLSSSHDSKSSASNSNLASLGLNNGETPASEAMDMVREWDKDDNGTLSQDELQQGLADLKERIKKQQERATGGDAFEQMKLNQYENLQTLGQDMLEKFDSVSKMDNRAGISTSDIKLLAFQDNNPHSISAKELA